MTHAEDRERRKQIAIGVAFLFGLTVIVCCAIYGWRLLPGILGEWVGTMVGVMTTPFILEASFVILGFVIVIGLNSWRRHRDGDELVFLEQLEGPDLPENLPDHAKWAVYKNAPLAGVIPDSRVQIEGALEIGDLDAATEILASMSEQELASPEVLALRLRLAEATGKPDLVRKLKLELESRASLHG